MNLPLFIAKRLALSKSVSFTRVIIGIAITAIAISLSVMILANAMIAGFKKEIHNKIFGFWGHIHISDINISRDFELTPFDINKDYYKQLEQIKQVIYQIEEEAKSDLSDKKYKEYTTKGGVNHIQPFIIHPGLLESKNEFQAILFKGVDSTFDWSRMKRFLVKDVRKTEALRENEVVISKILADKLKIEAGQDIILSFVKARNKVRRKLNVVGIYNTGLEEYDKRYIIGNITKVRQLLGWNDNQVAGIEVFLDDIEDSEVITEHIYTNILPDYLYPERIQSKFPGIFEWLKLQDINEKVILQLMAVVAIINMITVLLILILERTHMIGLLKALGATNWKVQKIFLYSAAFIIAMGQLIGNAIGLGLAFLQKKFSFIKLDEANYYLDTAPIHIDWTTILTINIGAFLITLIFLIIPTFIVTRIKPVTALKFD